MKTQKPQLSVIKFSQRISPWSITSGGYLTQTVDFNPYESELPLDTSTITSIEKDGEKYSHYTAPSHDKKVQNLFDIHFRLSTHDQLTVIPLIKPYKTVQEGMYHTHFIPHVTPDDVRAFREVLRLKIADRVASARAVAELTEISVNVQAVCQAIQTDIEPLLYEHLKYNKSLKAKTYQKINNHYKKELHVHVQTEKLARRNLFHQVAPFVLFVCAILIFISQ